MPNMLVMDMEPTADCSQPEHFARSRRLQAWHPLAGKALLDRLRITGRPRPCADPELAARLRAGIERSLGQVPLSSLEVVTKGRLNRVLTCEDHRAATEFGTGGPSVAMACGALVDVLFRQLMTVGSIGDAMADGMAALAVDDHRRDLVSWIDHLGAADRAELAAEVARQADGISRRWPILEPGWFPRTQQSVRTRLLEGTIELSGRVDLAVGRPAEGAASVAFVEIKAGGRRVEHRADLHFYALVETLRSSVPPFVVATYYSRTGELDVDPVTDDLLVAAARRTAAGVAALRDPSSNTWCPRCLAPTFAALGNDGERTPTARVKGSDR